MYTGRCWSINIWFTERKHRFHTRRKSVYKRKIFYTFHLFATCRKGCVCKHYKRKYQFRSGYSDNLLCQIESYHTIVNSLMFCKSWGALGYSSSRRSYMTLCDADVHLPVYPIHCHCMGSFYMDEALNWQASVDDGTGTVGVIHVMFVQPSTVTQTKGSESLFNASHACMVKGIMPIH
jgi:hypothetical protein